MDRVIIGVDPHKLSVTIEARDNREILRATGRFGTDTRSYHQLLKVARQWPERIWAVEGANGIGRPLAQRLLAGGERVLDVPAKLAARARVFGTGQGRKTDPADAHAIVMVALRDKGLRELSADPELMVLRMLCDRRDEISRARAQALNRLHRLFLELLAGGAPVKKTTAQYKALLASVRPQDPAGKIRRRMAAEEIADLERYDAKLKAMKAGLKAAVAATGSHLTGICGIGPAGAARILADAGDIARFPAAATSRPGAGTAPIDASSGQHTHHRLSRAGNRRLGHVLYIAGILQLRHDTPGRAYYRRKLTAGKTPMEAMRCLRRRLPDAACRQLVADATGQDEASPGGHPGASVISSAAGLSPDTGPSDQPLPGPAHPTLPPPPPARQTIAPAAAATRRRARGVNVQRPTGRTTLTPTSAAAPSNRRGHAS